AGLDGRDIVGPGHELDAPTAGCVDGGVREVGDGDGRAGPDIEGFTLGAVGGGGVQERAHEVVDVQEVPELCAVAEHGDRLSADGAAEEDLRQAPVARRAPGPVGDGDS